MRPMTCKALIEFLDDYVDGSLAPDARAQFEAHLAQCPPCVDYLRTYRDTIALARRACDETADAGAAPGVPEELVTVVLKAVKPPP